MLLGLRAVVGVVESLSGPFDEKRSADSALEGRFRNLKNTGGHHTLSLHQEQSRWPKDGNDY